MQSLDRNLHLFENGTTKEMFAKTHAKIVLELFGTQDMSSVRTGTVRLECTFTEPLEESIELVSLNQFEICWEITPDGSVQLDLAP
jgi:hypothetical protein